MRLPDADAALALIKPSVRSEQAYSLVAPVTARKLNQNEAPEDVPPDIKDRILDRARSAPWNRYPEFFPLHLAEALASRHRWTPEGVLVGNGSNELIQATLAVTVGPGVPVVAPTPTFALYRLLTAVNGGRYVPVPLGDDFRYDVPALLGACRREAARIVILNSPNNPTGSALPPGAVERFLAETDALVVCDEAYQDFGGPTALDLLPASPRLVVLRTFSKAMGMAGLRFGYALAHPDVAREIAKAKLPYNVNRLTLAAAEVALAESARFAERVAAIVAERGRLAAGLAGLPGVTVFDSSANFVLARFEDRDPRSIFHRLIEDHAILVRDVSRGDRLAGCLRISVGSAADTDAVVGALRRLLNEGN